MKRPIALGLSPNTESLDVRQAIVQFFSFWSYKEGENIRQLEQWFCNYFGVSYAVSFNSGRSAMVALLKAFDVKEGDEVILQAFTCVAVPNAILALNAVPVYADINESFTLDANDVAKKISKKTKAFLVQHTFGIPSDMEKLQSLAKQHKLYLIEDCAHTIGSMYKNKKLGTLGDGAFFSFGRDKAFSSVFGGMAVTNNQTVSKKIKTLQKDRPFPDFFWIAQQLLHPIAFSIILPLYNVVSLGKIMLFILQKLRFLSFPVFPEELQGKMEKGFVKKMPNAQASLALLQLKRVSKFNKKREFIAALYKSELSEKIPFVLKQAIPFLRYPTLVNRRDELLFTFRKDGIYLGNWYAHVVDPKGADFAKVGYKMGSCPNAELAAKKVINLPTYPTMTIADANRVITLFKQHES